MKNNKGKAPMNFFQSKRTSSRSKQKQPLRQMPKFMPMSSTSTQVDHSEAEDIRNASFINEVEENMQLFWGGRLPEITQTPPDHIPTILPIIRIRKAMKSNDKVEMMRSDVPVLIAKACEYLVMELILRASMNVDENERRKLNRTDIAEVIGGEQHLAFLNHIVVPTELRTQPTELRTQPLEVHLPSVNYSDDVYIPQLIREVPEIPVTGDHHFAYPYPMNLDDNFNHDFFMRSRDIQENIPSASYQQPSSSGDGVNLHFKDFFQ